MIQDSKFQISDSKFQIQDSRFQIPDYSLLIYKPVAKLAEAILRSQITHAQVIHLKF